MKIEYFMEHPEEYDKVEETDDNVLGLEPKSTASPEAIQSVLHFQVLADNIGTIIEYEADRLSQLMIEKFQQSKCYRFKTEQEREEVIKYLKEHPDAKDKYRNSIIDY